MKIKFRILLILTIAYIYIPTALFIAGWTRPLIACITLMTAAIGLVFMASDYCKKGKDLGYDEEKDIYISVPLMLIASVSIILICVFIGFGGIYPQAGDWYKHNAVLRDLTIEKWPVYYRIYDNSMLTYYVGQYLLPAIIGKLFNSFEVSNSLMMIWGIAGVILTYLHLLRVTRANSAKKQLFALLYLFFFCGALVLAQDILQAIYAGEMYSDGSYHWIIIRDVYIQYRSNLVMLRWVFPQTIVPWIVTILFLENVEKVKYYVLLVLPVIIFGSFSFVAFAVIALVCACTQLFDHKIGIKDIFSPFNILPAITMGSIFFFYFLGFMLVEKPYSSAFRWQAYPGWYILIYFVFCLFMFGINAFVAWEDNKKNILFYINLLILLFLPWCHMGLCNDIVMSASIPSLFYIMIISLQFLFKEEDSTKIGIKKGILLCVFFIGAWYPARELKDNIRANTRGMDLGDGYESLKWFSDRSATDISEDLVYNYYTYDLDSKIFYKYIARTRL